MSYIESYSPEIVNKLINLSHSDYEETRNKYPYLNNKGETTNIKFEVNCIRKLCRQASKNNYKREIKYKFGEGRNSGRLYADGASLQSLPKFVRGVLCGDRTYDIDAVNCHPQLLLSMCLQNKIPCQNLSSYISTREEKLKDFMESDNIDRSKAKQLFIKCINKETKTTKIGKCKVKSSFFQQYDDEMRNIVNKFIELNPELYTEIQSRERDNHGGKLMAWLLNEAEGKMLDTVIENIKDKYIIRTLAFDGLMVDKYNYDGDNIDAKTLIDTLDKTTENIGIRWTLKPHDMSALPKFMDLNNNTEENAVIYGNNEMDIVEQLFNLKFKDRFYRMQNELYLLHNRVWISNRQHILEIIRKAVRHTQGLVEHPSKSGDPTYENITQSLTKSKSVINALIEIVPENETFIENIEKRSLGKISYQNGYIDFRLGRFIEYNKHNSDYDTINIINRDFEYISPHDPIRIALMEKIFKPMFCIEQEDSDDFHLMEYFLHTQARAIAGEIEDKIFTIITGERDSCKSAYNDLLFSSFGSYIQMFNMSTFELKKDTGEEARKLGALVKFRFARLITSQEISDKWLDGTLLKKLSSGGDPITARGLYKDEVTFTPQFKVMASGNQNPRMKPVDAMEKCFHFTMKCKFVDKMPEKKSPLLKYYYKDSKIKHFVRRDDIGNAMASLLLDYYKRTDTFQPESTKEEDEVNIDPEIIIKENFEITENSNDRILNNEFDEYIFPKLKNHFDSSRHLRKMLKHAGAIPFNQKGRGLKNVVFIGDDEVCDDI